MEAQVTIDTDDLWYALSDSVEDCIADKLTEFIHEDDLECQLANMIEEKEIVTADMVCDVSEFEERVDTLERTVANQASVMNLTARVNAFQTINDAVRSENIKLTASIKDLQYNHDRWASENHRLRDENNQMREDIHYLFERVNDLESRTLRGRWDTLTCWVRSKFRGS